MGLSLPEQVQALITEHDRLCCQNVLCQTLLGDKLGDFQALLPELQIWLGQFTALTAELAEQQALDLTQLPDWNAFLTAYARLPDSKTMADYHLVLRFLEQLALTGKSQRAKGFVRQDHTRLRAVKQDLDVLPAEILLVFRPYRQLIISGSDADTVDESDEAPVWSIAVTMQMNQMLNQLRQDNPDLVQDIERLAKDSFINPVVQDQAPVQIMPPVIGPDRPDQERLAEKSVGDAPVLTGIDPLAKLKQRIGLARKSAEPEGPAASPTAWSAAPEAVPAEPARAAAPAGQTRPVIEPDQTTGRQTKREPEQKPEPPAGEMAVPVAEEPFIPNQSVRAGEIAAKALSYEQKRGPESDEQQAALCRRLIGQLLLDREAVMAHELASFAEHRYPDWPCLDARLIKALATLTADCGEAVNHADLWIELSGKHAKDWTDWRMEAMYQASLLTVSPLMAELYVALPQQVADQVPSLAKLADAFNEVKIQQAQIPRATILSRRSGSDVRQELADYAQRKSDFFYSREHLKFNYQLATNMMQYLMRKDQYLGQLSEWLEHEQLSEAQETRLSEAAKTCRDHAAVDEICDQAMQKVARQRARTLVGAAMNKTYKIFASVGSLIDERIELHQRTRGRQRSLSSSEEHADQLIASFAEICPAIRQEVADRLGNVTLTPDDRLLFGMILRVLDALETLYCADANQTVPSIWPIVADELSVKYLGEPDFSLDDDHRLLMPESAEFDHFLRSIARSALPASQLIEINCQAGNLANAARIMDEITRVDSKTAHRLQQQLDQAARAGKARLDEDIQQTLNRLAELFFSEQELDEQRKDLIRRVQEIEHTAGEQKTQPFAWNLLGNRLEQINRDICLLHDQQTRELRARITGQRDTVPDDVRLRVETLLDQGQFILAAELLNRKTLDQPDETRDMFMETYFAPEVYDEIYTQVVAAPKDPLSAYRRAQLPKGQLEADSPLAGLSQSWNLLKRSGQPEKDLVTALMTQLGFQSLKEERRFACVSPVMYTGEFSFKPSRNRNDCPVALFGSGSGSRLTVLVVRQTTLIEHLTRIINESSREKPSVVLVLGAMQQSVRRRIAVVCRQQERPILFLDEVLLAAVCAEPENWYHRLFLLALPFACIHPYASTAGIVAPEMFYGRRKAKNQIMARPGTCVIYGGRQLGKTALLKEIAGEVHNPEQGQIALWIDLKACQIGYEQPPLAIFALIARQLHGFGVVSDTGNQTDALFAHIKTWLNQQPNRRILLLLDEADQFLNQDRQVTAGQQPFSITSKLISLVTDTSSAFKFVFAGLHNVQRAIRVSNSPLVHLGQPICIGPFHENGDVKEARRLIKEPFGYLGYRFASEDMVETILIQTNFYPSLIQLYGYELLRHVQDNCSFAEEQIPPYTLTYRHLQEVYQKPELRKSISDRFMWTIELEPRYRAIALLIANGCHEEKAKGLTGLDQGFSLPWLQEAVQAFYQETFTGSDSLDDLHILADELVELGILRQINQTLYTLRNPIVLSLLGSADRIMQQILEPVEPAAADTERPEPVEIVRVPQKNRAINRLTGNQIRQLAESSCPVGLIYGSDALGIEQVAEELVSGMAWRKVEIWSSNNSSSLIKTLKEQIASGTAITWILKPDLKWTSKWIKDVAHVLEGQNQCRAVFIIDAARAWKQLVETGQEELAAHTLFSLHLEPWDTSEAEQHLKNAGLLPAKRAERDRLIQAIDGWPNLLESYRQAAREQPGKLDEQLRFFYQSAFRNLKLFGLEHDDARHVMLAFRNGQDLSAETVMKEAKMSQRSDTDRILSWLEQMALITRQDSESVTNWRLNRAFQQYLAQLPEASKHG